MNWDDPAARLALVERVGHDEYNRLIAEHHEASVVSTINGHAIRPVNSGRFGRLYMIGSTGIAYPTMPEAVAYAESMEEAKP